MSVLMNQSFVSAPLRGVKRTAPDDLEREQRLSKRFDLLNIDHQRGKLYIPVASSHGRFETQAQANPPQPDRGQQDSHCMEIEDTSDRIYIGDLDAELADLEPSTPAHPIFLPDIEKHLLGLPSAVFEPSAEEEQQRREREQAMQLVVYSVPSSLTVSAEQDNVRRAIEEARRRVRQGMPLGAHQGSLPSSPGASIAGEHQVLDTGNIWNNPGDHDIEMDVDI